MVCLSPVQGYKSKFLSPKGKCVFTRSESKASRSPVVVNGFTYYAPVSMSTRCHRCEGCRYDASREMAVRVSHEAFMYDRGFDNSFITLTYNDEHLPPFGALDYFGDWDRFLQSFRDHLALEGIRIRYYMVGEYGDLNLRPHYHAIIFGYSFPDKQFAFSRNGNDLYRSDLLESLWTSSGSRAGRGDSLGFSTIGLVNFSVAAYVARYNMKKLMGNHSVDLSQYEDENGVLIPKRSLRFHPETGDPIMVPRERALMSKRPGIGKSWFDSFAVQDLYSKDFMHTDKGIIRAPAYYDRLLDKVSPEMLANLKKSRQSFADANPMRHTPEALKSARAILLAKLARSVRPL